MWKRIFLFSAILLVPAASPFADQKTKPKVPQKLPPLTEEEKQILKDREILENLVLLQNFDKIRYFEFFDEKKEDTPKSKNLTEPAPAKDTGKKP
jgi:hypothetical protein